MSYSYSLSESTTFSVTHAKHISAKVATDLKRIQRFYGDPDDFRISQYEEEIIAFLKAGYLDTVVYGYRRDSSWIEPTLKYTARDLAGATTNDDDPGRIRSGADITGASFCSHLYYSPEWDSLTDSEKEAFNKMLPFKRSGAPEPSVSGYFSADRIYSAGGKAMDRSSLRSY